MAIWIRSYRMFRLAAPGRLSVLETWGDLSAYESPSLTSPENLLLPFNAFKLHIQFTPLLYF